MLIKTVSARPAQNAHAATRHGIQSRHSRVATPTIVEDEITDGLVIIACATPGAEIYYTINGNVPSMQGGTLYEAPVQLMGTATVRAAAYLEGRETSFINSAIIEISFTPTIRILEWTAALANMGLPE